MMKFVNMKRKMAATVAAMMLATTAAMPAVLAEETTTAPEQEAIIGMANPWSELESLQELNAAAGVQLLLPGVMGVTNVHYRLMTAGETTLAEVSYQVNGMRCTMRASANMEGDISGVYLWDGQPAFDMTDPLDIYEETLEMKLIRWEKDGVNYVLMVQDDNEMSFDTFMNIVFELQSVQGVYEVAPVEFKLQDISFNWNSEMQATEGSCTLCINEDKVSLRIVITPSEVEEEEFTYNFENRILSINYAGPILGGIRICASADLTEMPDETLTAALDTVLDAFVESTFGDFAE